MKQQNLKKTWATQSSQIDQNKSWIWLIGERSHVAFPTPNMRKGMGSNWHHWHHWHHWLLHGHCSSILFVFLCKFVFFPCTFVIFNHFLKNFLESFLCFGQSPFWWPSLQQYWTNWQLPHVNRLLMLNISPDALSHRKCATILHELHHFLPALLLATIRLQSQNWSRAGRSRASPELVQSWSKAGPELIQSWSRVGPELVQNC